MAAFLAYSQAMRMEAVFCCETSVYFYRTARHHMPEDDRFTIHKFAASYLDMKTLTAREVDPQPFQALAVAMLYGVTFP